MKQYLNTNPLIIFILAFGLPLFIGCKPTRSLTADQYLLKKNTVVIDGKAIDKQELQSYYRQRPNDKFLIFFNFKLSVYNFSQLGKKRKWKSWLERVIGDPPVVYDSVMVIKTRQQFERYLKNESFYRGEVSSFTNFKKQRAYVTYQVRANEPLIINSVNYNIEDSTLTELILSDTLKSVLKPGKPFALEYINHERDRITNQLQVNGYYKFTTDFIKYEIDSSYYKANITVVVSKNVVVGVGSSVLFLPHKKFTINNIYFYPDFDPQAALRNRKLYENTFDSVDFNGYKFIYPGYENIKPQTILKAGDLKPGQIYNLAQVKSTNNYINSLRIFRLNNIYFKDIPGSDSIIDCHIQLTPFTYQNFSVNSELTNTKGNIGIGGALNYQHKNVFRGAEIFNMKLLGSVQFVNATEDQSAFSIIELGAESSISTPSFVLPFTMDRFYKKYNPKTAFTLAINYQDRPDYMRIIYSASMGYYWQAQKTMLHSIIPIDLSSVKVNGTEEFMDSIKGTYLENNYRDYFIAGGRYSFIYTSLQKNMFDSYYAFRWNFDMAGNMLYLFDQLFLANDTVEGGYHTIFGLQYAQYVKTDLDYRFYNILGRRHQIVYRAFGGIAIPYGNANAVTFVKQYYSGGAEGLRAWAVKDLGPGTFKQEGGYPNQTADIKLEFNTEYRFDITRSFKGAAFIDVSNIWSINKDDDRPGALFKFNQFYKEFAVGTGLGLRYDVSFAVIRVDAGIKVRDPSISGPESWILFQEPFNTRDVVWNLAIGYPF